jgi:hypothetical protein
VNPDPTVRYAHLDDEHALDAAERIGDVIERMLGKCYARSSRLLL